MPGNNAPIPRSPTLESLIAGTTKRVRRLEINHRYPSAGVATYTEAYDPAALTIWTPDFTGATQVTDEIGLTLVGGGVGIPNGWLAWVTVAFTLSCTDPPMGDGLLWSAGSLARADVLLNGAQAVSGVVSASSPWSGDVTTVELVGVQTAFGSLFSPTKMEIDVVGIQLPVAGSVGGGVIT
jgi:hypothetical protein